MPVVTPGVCGGEGGGGKRITTCSRPAWSTIRGYPGLHRETVSKTEQKMYVRNKPFYMKILDICDKKYACHLSQ